MSLTQKQLETLKQNNENSNYITKEAIRGALYLIMEAKPFKRLPLKLSIVLVYLVLLSTATINRKKIY